jgi:hypothetical protein
MKKYGKSSFWLFDDDPLSDKILNKRELSSKVIYKLAAHRRAVANFVSIVTGKNIPVKFNVRGDSYTDGKSVIISSDITKPDEFDPAVGLALHEGSHILLSDFSVLRKLKTKVSLMVSPHRVNTLEHVANERNIDFEPALKQILNWVEDRRIDQYIYKNSPGYRDYYIAMYDKFFNHPIIEKALQSDEYTDETFESYMFRLINLHSKNTRLNALKHLTDIYHVVDLKNIARLKTTEDALLVAFYVLEIIVNAMPPASNADSKPNKPNNDTESQNSGGESDGDGEQEDGEQEDGEQGDGKQGDGEQGDGEQGDGEQGDGEQGDGEQGDGEQGDGEQGDGDDQKITMSPRQLSTLRGKINKQHKFLNGEIKKCKVTTHQSVQLETIEESGTELKPVGVDCGYSGNSPGVECVVVKKMTRNVMLDFNFPITVRKYKIRPDDDVLRVYNEDSINDGIRIGSVLGKKLQVRTESRETVYNRQVAGKIDKRMISSLGYGNELVFFTRNIDSYKKANLHISVDASGSMSGKKWYKTITNVVAICKAVDMINNLNVQVSFRTTSQSMPWIVIAYDSRVDKFEKVKNLFKYITPNGCTPEGLAFEAITKYMVSGSGELDSYFLNISDGEPYFIDAGFKYEGMVAIKHTRKMVNEMIGKGIKVLSYFVDSRDVTGMDDSYTGLMFKESYGSSAKFINITNTTQIITTLNKLFMEK